jgi:hypothetical protein
MTNPLFCLRVPEDVMARIPRVLRGGETRPVFIREAVVRELERREAILAKNPRAIERFFDD